jgi:hypothetical protein
MEGKDVIVVRGSSLISSSRAILSFILQTRRNDGSDVNSQIILYSSTGLKPQIACD